MRSQLAWFASAIATGMSVLAGEPDARPGHALAVACRAVEDRVADVAQECVSPFEATSLSSALNGTATLMHGFSMRGSWRAGVADRATVQPTMRPLPWVPLGLHAEFCAMLNACYDEDHRNATE